MKSVSLTHTGMVRKENQDSVINLRDMKGNYFIGVADGMGGHKAGDVASRTLTEELIRFFRKADKRKCYQDPEYLKGIIRQINKRIYELSRSQTDYEGMGTTLTLCMTNGKFGRICQVGDSRAYIVGEEGIHQITRDQSLVQFMVDNNQITPEEARVHPSRHVILSAVGTEEDVDIDMYAFTIQKGEKMLHNKIYYTTTNSSKLFPATTEPSLFGAILISNTYRNGVGVMVFDDNISTIGEATFQGCLNLKSVTIPDEVTVIGKDAFYKCI